LKNLFVDMPELYDLLAPLALDGKLLAYLVGIAQNFDQKTPYHHLSLFDHTCAAVSYALAHNANDRVVTALRWHDLGKVYTQSMVNIPNGTPDGEMRAHYYGHAVASRDLYLLHLRPNQLNEETNYIAALILNHDRHLNRRVVKQLLAEGWTSDFIRDLMLVQQCDKFAQSDYAKERNTATFEEGLSQARDVLRTAKAMEKVRAHYDYLVAQGYEVAGIFLYGSQNYGLDYEDSDYDTKAIVIPTFENYVHSKTRISTVLITPENEHIDVKDIRSMFDNLAKSNINFLEILFTKFRILSPRYSELLAPIFQRREEIATYDMQGMLNAACGMSMQKLKALQHPYPTIVDKIERFGYDPKQLHHICRLHEFLSRVTGGESFAASLKSKQRERFVQLKRGVLPVDEAVALAQTTDRLTHDLKVAWIDQHAPVVNEDIPLLLDKVCYEVLKTRFTRELLAAQFKL